MHVAAPNWACIGANDFVLSVLSHGYNLEFITPPPLQVNPTPFYLNLNAEQQQILDDEMFKYMTGCVIEEVTDLSTPGFYSPLFLRPKTDTGWRVIINISQLNRHLVYRKFKMETMATVRQGLRKGCYAFSLDLSSAYHHVPIHPASRKYLRFFWRNRCFQFRVLPFGVSPAPWLFSLIVAQVARFFHTHSVPSHFYLDDWEFWHWWRHLLTKNQPTILFIVRALGWIVNETKSELEISQHDVYIGGDFNLALGTVCPTQKRWQKINQCIPQLCRVKFATAKFWASVLGMLTSAQDLTPMGRLQLRSLQYHVNRYWQDRRSPFVLIPVTPNVLNGWNGG